MPVAFNIFLYTKMIFLCIGEIVQHKSTACSPKGPYFNSWQTHGGSLKYLGPSVA